MVSGLLYRRRTLKSELLSFGIPLMVFSVLQFSWYLAYDVFFTHNLSITDLFAKSLPTLLNNNDDTYILFEGCWFIFGLLFIRLMLLGINISRWGLPLAVICLCLTEANNQLNLLPILKHWHIFKPIEMFPIFWIGYYLKSSNIEMNLMKSLVCLVIFVTITLLNGDVDMWDGTLGHCYTALVVANMFLFIAFIHLLNIPSNITVTTLSIGTLAILGSHMFMYNINSSVIRHILALFTNYEPEFLFQPIPMTILYIIEIIPMLYIIEKRCPIVLGKLKPHA